MGGIPQVLPVGMYFLLFRGFSGPGMVFLLLFQDDLTNDDLCCGALVLGCYPRRDTLLVR